VSHIGLVLLALALSFVSPATTEIERAFLQNDPSILHSLIAPGSFVNLSFADPIRFSDLLSDEQTDLWFRKFFGTYKTVGFYPEGSILRSLDRGSFIFKARWEIQAKGQPQQAFDVLFFIRGKPSGAGLKRFWSILQIRAENPERH
jgi:hypothetical protein